MSCELLVPTVQFGEARVAQDTLAWIIKDCKYHGLSRVPGPAVLPGFRWAESFPGFPGVSTPPAFPSGGYRLPG